MRNLHLPRRISYGLYLPHGLLLMQASNQDVIRRDMSRWLDSSGSYTPTIKDLVRILYNFPEFRNVFYYRLKKDRHLRILRRIAMSILPAQPLLSICTPVIGPGFFIEHGFSTIISARSIGGNAWINQQVTIGYTGNDECPTIGDNVRITAGAKVLGNITVGDNVVIGANAVVVKNVPSNCTVVGVPAYIIKRDGRKVREPLL